MLENVVFISISNFMEGREGFRINNFLVREDIALPLFVHDSESVSLNQITPENVISGMIRVLIDDPENENIDYYREFIFAVQPDIEARLTSVAYEAEKNELFTEALDIYHVLYALKPDSLDHTLNIAVCYDDYSQSLYTQGKDSDAGKFEEEAYRYFKVIEESDEKDERAYYYLGRFYLVRENYNKTLNYFNSFLQDSSDEDRRKEVILLINNVARGGLNDEDYQDAITFVQSEKYDEALKSIEKFSKKYPDSWNGCLLRGKIQSKTKHYNEAISLFNEALKLNPENSDIYNELGLCYMNLKIFHKSEYYFAMALKKNPEDCAVIFNLAMNSFQKGNKEEAIKYLDVINEFNPNDLHYKNLRSIIEEG